MGQYLRRRRAARRRRGGSLRPHPAAGARPLHARAHRPPGRELLLLAGLRAAPADFLGTVDDHPAARPRGAVPRQRLGRRQYRGSAHQDVHAGQRRRFRHRPPRAGPQLLSARLQSAAVPLSRQRQ